MMGTTHAAFALLCYYLIAYLAELPFNAPMVLILLVAGSLLPDIDHPRAFLGRQFYLLRHSSRGVSKFVVHSLLAALVATAVAWIIAIFYR